MKEFKIGDTVLYYFEPWRDHILKEKCVIDSFCTCPACINAEYKYRGADVTTADGREKFVLLGELKPCGERQLLFDWFKE